MKERDVRETYDYIAGHFAETREHPWPEVESFVAEHRTDRETGRVTDRALDLGCANGRHADLLADHTREVVGVDVSRELLAEARARASERDFSVELVQADAAALPLRDATVGVAVYVATLHHLRTRATRVESLNELARVLDPAGTALVSAWSTAHDRFNREGDEGESGGRESDGEASDEAGFDTTVDWTLPGGETVPRFYHIYSPAEFRADLAESALAVEDDFVSSGNCYAVVRKG